jgi:hypothetical protein
MFNLRPRRGFHSAANPTIARRQTLSCRFPWHILCWLVSAVKQKKPEKMKAAATATNVMKNRQKQMLVAYIVSTG